MELVLGLVFGTIGFGFLMYGRKQHAMVPVVCGLLLMIVPYFISDARLLFGACAVLVAVPFFVRE
jgi:hypothetical protein